ncbi:hypothetical protein D3C77_673350 [compost metagenome]
MDDMRDQGDRTTNSKTTGKADNARTNECQQMAAHLLLMLRVYLAGLSARSLIDRAGGQALGKDRSRGSR